MSTPRRPDAPQRPRRHSGIGVPAEPVANATPSRAPRPATDHLTAAKAGNPPRPSSGEARKPVSPRNPLSTTRPARVAASPVTAKSEQKTKKKLSFGGLSASVRMISVAVVLGMVGLNLIPIGMQWYQQEQEYRAVRAELDAANLRHQELQDSIAAWDNDNFVANEAKTRLGYVWPGEVQYNVVGLPETAQSGEDEASLSVNSPVRPWTSTILQSMIEADQPGSSSELGSLVPTFDPKKATEDEDAGA